MQVKVGLGQGAAGRQCSLCRHGRRDTGNQIGDAGATALSGALPSLRSLTSLNLSSAFAHLSQRCACVRGCVLMAGPGMVRVIVAVRVYMCGSVWSVSV